MSFMDYFGGKSRAEVVALPKKYFEMARAWIQTNPEYGAAAGVAAGVVLVFAFKFVFSVAVIAASIFGVMYFMAKDIPPAV